MKDPGKTLEVIRYWWNKAEECLESAQREYDAKSYEFAMNRLYYAVFYGVSAGLLEQKKTFKKHSGVRSGFHNEYIKTGILEVKWGKFYDHLFEDRQEADYITFASFEETYVNNQLEQCKQFLTKLRPLIPSLE